MLKIMKTKPGPKRGRKLKGTNPFIFGQILMRLRRKQGMTQKELAEKMGASIRMISYFEREMSNPEMETIEKLSRALNVPKEKIIKPDKQSELHSPIANRTLEKRLRVVEGLPEEDQKYVFKTIDMLVEKNSPRNGHVAEKKSV